MSGKQRFTTTWRHPEPEDSSPLRRGAWRAKDLGFCGAWSLTGHCFPWLVRTCCRIQAALSDDQPAYRLVANDVRVHDLVQVLFTHAAIPNRFRIDDHVWPVLALIKTAGFIRTDFSFEPSFRELCLQGFLQLSLATWIAAPARTGSIAHVRADEYVSFKFRHLYASAFPLSFSKTLIGAAAGSTSAARGTMNVCSSANRPLSAACGTPSVKTSHVHPGGNSCTGFARSSSWYRSFSFSQSWKCSMKRSYPERSGIGSPTARIASTLRRRHLPLTEFAEYANSGNPALSANLGATL